MPRLRSQHKGDLFAPVGQRAGNKSQRQETKDKRKGKRNKGEGDGIFVLRDKRLSLNIEKTNMAQRQMAVFPFSLLAKWGTSC